MLSLVFVHFANAQTTLEDTNVKHNQSVSYSDLFVIALNAPHLQILPSWVFCSCIETAKYLLGKQGESWGNASEIKPNVSSPIINGLVLTNESKLGHIGVITKIEKDGFWIVEGNYKPCQKTIRFIKNDAKFIRGFSIRK